MRLVSVSHEGEVLQDTYYSRDFEPGDFNVAAGEGWRRTEHAQSLPCANGKRPLHAQISLSKRRTL